MSVRVCVRVSSTLTAFACCRVCVRVCSCATAATLSFRITQTSTSSKLLVFFFRFFLPIVLGYHCHCSDLPPHPPTSLPPSLTPPPPPSLGSRASPIHLGRFLRWKRLFPLFLNPLISRSSSAWIGKSHPASPPSNPSNDQTPWPPCPRAPLLLLHCPSPGPDVPRWDSGDEPLKRCLRLALSATCLMAT